MVEIPPGMVTAKRNAERDLLDRHGVVGVGIGLAESVGESTDVVAIKVYVEPGHPVRASLPAALEGHPVTVVEQPRIEFLGVATDSGARVESSPDKSAYNPVCGGISAGPTKPFGVNNVTGTLGAVVIDNETGKPMLLSNYHVFAVEGDWHGNHITQPAVEDGPISVVGHLERAVLSEEVDAAVAWQTSRDFTWSIHDLGDINGTARVEPTMAVKKRGRTTGVTSGIVESIDYSFDTELPVSHEKRHFTNQILIKGDTTFAGERDSGAVVVDSACRVVGLLFATSHDGAWGIANDIAKVTEALKVTIPRSDGRPWIDKHVVLDKEHTSGGSVVVNCEDRGLLLAWAGSTDKKINIAYSPDVFETYQKTTLDQKVYGEPALVVCSPNGDVGAYLAWTGTNTAGNLNVAWLRVTGWSDWSIVRHRVLDETSDASPGLARLDNGTLVLAWRGKGNRSLNIATSTDGGYSFPNKVVTNQLSPEGPAIANIDGQLYLLWQGTDNVPNIAKITSLNPITLGEYTILTGQRCYGHPSLGSAGERVLAWRGTDRDGTINALQAEGDGAFEDQLVFAESTVAPPTLCRSNESFFMAWTGTNFDRNPNIARLRFGPKKPT